MKTLNNARRGWGDILRIFHVTLKGVGHEIYNFCWPIESNQNFLYMSDKFLIFASKKAAIRISVRLSFSVVWTISTVSTLQWCKKNSAQLRTIHMLQVAFRIFFSGPCAAFGSFATSLGVYLNAGDCLMEFQEGL
jgi:hypothetical protein